MMSKRKKGHRKGAVGFKDVPLDDKPLSKEEEEKHRKFVNLRRNHYKDEFQKLKNRPPPDDDEEDGDANATSTEGGTTTK